MVEQEVPKLPNYETFIRNDEVQLFRELNSKSKQGYKLHSVIAVAGGVLAVMVLDKGSYEDVTNLADVSPSDVDQYLANGWELASTSISTKFVRMIKRATT